MKIIYFWECKRCFLYFFDVISQEKIRMEKFSVVSKIRTKNVSKIEKFDAYFSFEILSSCKIFAFYRFVAVLSRERKRNLKFPIVSKIW